MKRNLLLATLLALGIGAYAEGIVFEHATWAEVVKKSQAMHRPIFVDFYAVWCGPCKMMTRDVFTQAAVGEYFNNNFISFKIDAEKEELPLVQTIGLDAYPTLAFFDSNGKFLQKQVGAIDGPRLLMIGKSVIELPLIKERVLSGKAPMEEVLLYVGTCKDADPETFNKLAPGLAKSYTLEDLKGQMQWKIFTQTITDLESPLFQMVISNAGVLNEAHDDFRTYGNEVMGRYFAKMTAAGNLAGLSLYKKNMQTVFQQLGQSTLDAKYFDLWVNSDYYLQRKELPQYAASLTLFVDTYVMNDPSRLSASAISLSANMSDDAHRRKAIGWAQAAVALKRSKESVFSLAKVYENTGDKVKAAATAGEVLTFELTEDESNYVRQYIGALKP